MTGTSSSDRPVLVVAGARPNFMKVVPILHELDRRGIKRLFVHTGQHYDVRMSEALLKDLGAPQPDVMLEVGSASHAVQTARVMERFEPVLREHRPSWVIVVGDVNSTLACALVVSKLREELDCRLAHVEAGLRSNDWTMPEEVNRVVTDRLSDLLLTPSTDVGPNLAREGLTGIRTVFVGNVMIDSLLAVLPRARSLDILARLGVAPGHVLATLHRPSNVDEPARLAVLLEALAKVAETRQVVFPIHPRTRTRVAAAGLVPREAGGHRPGGLCRDRGPRGLCRRRRDGQRRASRGDDGPGCTVPDASRADRAPDHGERRDKSDAAVAADSVGDRGRSQRGAATAAPRRR
jgi:UDP-N-acetylglucosamine 2-epimerase (non-hydrolysing)